MRRALSILLLLVIVAATAWTLLNWNRKSITASDPWSAIPNRSAVVIEIPDAWTAWDKFTHTSQLWATAEAIPSAAALGRLMARTMERAENDAALRTALNEVSVLVAVMRTSSASVDLLFTCVPHSANGVPLQAFAELLKADDAILAALQRGETVQVRPDTALPALSWRLDGGLWLLATSPAMMDEAQLQLKSATGLAQDSLLTEARRSSGGGSDAHVLVHVERAKALLHRWWTPATIDALDLPSGWAALDLRARPDAFLLSGLLFPDTPHRTTIALGHQAQGRNDLARWIPAKADAWDVQHVDDPEVFLRDLGLVGEPDSIPFAADLFHWVNGSIGRAIAIDSVQGAQQWAYFQTDDTENATNRLNALCGGNCDTATYRSIRLTHLTIPHAHLRLLGSNYSAFEQPWWCVLGDVVTFSPTQQELFTVVDAWTDGRTLAEDRRTTLWTDRMASQAGRTLRWDVARHAGGFTNGLKAEERTAFNTYGSLLARLGGLSVQLSPAQHGRAHIAIGLQHAPLEERASGVHWSTAVPTGVTRKPDILRNHTNGTREVLVQDGAHRIHLLGSTGKELWGYALDGPIMGEVHQVDRYRNGKLQLVLNTAGRVYLIDRNGKDVGGFPVRLPSAATAPIAVYDYDAERDYRIVVPVTDGRLLNYGMEGTLVTGWETPRVTSPVKSSAFHIRIKNKDFIVLADATGKVHLLDRRGSERERTELSLGTGATVLSVQPGLDVMNSRILWTDSAGTLMSGNLNGRANTLSSVNNNWNGPGLLANDGHYDRVRIAMDTLAVSHGDRVVFSRTFGAVLAPIVNVYQLETGVATYGVVIPEREQVTLIDASGRELEGLPLQGATPFSIADLDLDGTLELITVTTRGEVIAYHALAPSNAR